VTKARNNVEHVHWRLTPHRTGASLDRRANMLMPSNTEIPDRATQAGIKVARQIGIGWIDPIILRHSEHVSIRLFPSDVVARVLVAARPRAEDQLRRELAVARHLVEKPLRSSVRLRMFPPVLIFKMGLE
jgi:hypothetical protein